MNHEASRRLRARAVVALLAAFTSVAGFVQALDFNDIVALKENRVADAVIMNMIRDSGGVALTGQQEAHLRGLGVSEALLAEVGASRPVPVQPPVQIVESAPSVTVVEPPSPIQVTEMAPLPARYAKEGWVSVSNSGWESYYLMVDQSAKRMFLSQVPNGGVEIMPGQNIALNVRKETYKLYGNNGRKLSVKVRENEVTRVTLTPFGTPGGGTLTASAQDRERVRSEIVFGMIMAAPAPAVIVEPAPPVFIHPAPVYVPYRRYHGPSYGYGYRW